MAAKRKATERVMDKAREMTKPKSIIPPQRKERRDGQFTIIKAKLLGKPFPRALNIVDDYDVTGDAAVDSIRMGLADAGIEVKESPELDTALRAHMERVEAKFGPQRR